MRQGISRLHHYLMATPRRRRLSWAALGLFVFWCAVSVFAWVAGPGLLRDYATRYVHDEFGHELSVGEIKVNPLWLAVTIHDLSLRSPKGAPLITFQKMVVDVDIQTLLRGMAVLDEFRLDGLVLSVERTGPDRFNFSDLSDRLAARAKAAEAASPKPVAVKDAAENNNVAVQFLVRHTELNNAAFHFVDHTHVPVFENWLRPINLAMDDLSSKPDSEAPYDIRATIGSGGAIGWKGDLTLQPLRSKGRLELTNFGLQVVHEYLQSQFAFTLQSGQMQVRVDYLADFSGVGSVLKITDGETSVDDLKVSDMAGNPLFAFTKTRATGIVADLINSSASIGLFETLGGKVDVELGADGSTNIQRALLPPPGMTPAASASEALTTDAAQSISEPVVAAQKTPESAAASSTETAAEASAWKIALERAAIRDYALTIVDRSTTPAANIALQNVSAEIKNVRFPEPVPLPFSLQASMATGGKFALQGEYRLDSGDVKADITVDGLALTPFTPYLASAGRMSITEGTAHWKGKASAANNGASKLRVEGSGGVRQLSLRDDVGQTRFFRLGELGIEGMSYDDQASRLAVRKMLIAGMQLDVVSDRNAITNLQRVFLSENELASLDAAAAKARVGSDDALTQAPPVTTESDVAVAGVTTEPAGNSVASASAPAPALQMRLDSLVLRDNQFSFRDESPDMPFSTQLTAFGGRINGLSTDPTKRATVDLSGTIDRYAPLVIQGEINPLASESFANIRIRLNSLDLVALTPYTVTYIAYPLQRGKFGFEADWNVKNNRFDSKNRMLIDGLALGEKQDAPRATKLPVKLGIALLTNREGDADLEVPAYGRLNDPKFKVGRVIMTALGNLLVRAATSPFAALGMLGGSEEGGKLAFMPGGTTLANGEEGKFAQIAKVLQDKPMLSLGIAGTASASDRLALQRAAVDLSLRQHYLDSPFRRGQNVADVELTPSQRASALESLYRKAFGDGLSSLRDAQGNPLMEDQRLLTAEQKLVERVVIDEGALRELARQRAQFAKDHLLAVGVPEAKLFVLESNVLAAHVSPIPTVMSLDAK